MSTFILRSDIVAFPGILILTLFVSTIWISSMQVNIVHAIPDQQQLATIKPIGVKITDPIKGQQIGVGKNLTLLGTSKYNASSSCQVFVIIDNMRPYQKVIPIGQAGADDFSKWRYALAPTYSGSIKEGINRITAKLLCNSNPTTPKFYSINITGVNETLPKQQHPSLSSNNTVAPFFLPVSSFASAPLNNTNAPPILPVSVNSSALIAPLSLPSISSSSPSSSSSSGDHHSNHSTSSNGDTHTSSSNHHSSNSGGNDNNHHHHKNNGGGGGGINLARSIISHFKGF
jgi:hypothetical protein